MPLRARNAVPGLVVVMAFALVACQAPIIRRDLPLLMRDCVETAGAGALSACNEALSQSPADSERALLLYRRASLLEAEGQAEAALIDLDAALVLRPQATSAYRLRSTVRARLGQVDAALADLREALRLAGHADVELLVWASYALEQMGGIEEGLQAASRALALAPRDATALNSRCWKLALLRRTLEQALADCELAVSLRPEESGTHDSLAFVLYRLRRYDEAVAAGTRALQLDPASRAAAHSWFIRGLARQALGDSAGAAADHRQAQTLDPGIAAYFRQFGVGR